jgi:hypothetical protein
MITSCFWPSRWHLSKHWSSAAGFQACKNSSSLLRQTHVILCTVPLQHSDGIQAPTLQTAPRHQDRQAGILLSSHFTSNTVGYLLLEMLGTRSVSDFKSFSDLECLHRHYQLSIPDPKIWNPKPNTCWVSCQCSNRLRRESMSDDRGQPVPSKGPKRWVRTQQKCFLVIILKWQYVCSTGKQVMHSLRWLSL